MANRDTSHLPLSGDENRPVSVAGSQNERNEITHEKQTLPGPEPSGKHQARTSREVDNKTNAKNRQVPGHLDRKP